MLLHVHCAPLPLPRMGRANQIRGRERERASVAHLLVGPSTRWRGKARESSGSLRTGLIDGSDDAGAHTRTDLRPTSWEWARERTMRAHTLLLLLLFTYGFGAARTVYLIITGGAQ